MKTLNLITIYKSPSDYPNQYVARRFELDKPTNEFFAHEHLSVVRKWTRERLWSLGVLTHVNMGREKNDDPVIVETWL